MKKIIFLMIVTLLLSSCNLLQKEDAKVNTSFLTGAYSKEFHELNLSSQELTQVPNFNKYLTGSYIDDVWSINLMNNKIQTVDEKIFEYFPNLKELNLSYNQIENIKLSHNFLKKVLLHKNKLTTVDLQGLTMLDDVTLGYNDFVDGNNILLGNSIKTLELQHNKLINLDLINELKNLIKLKLEYNSLDDNSIQGLKGLDKLKFITLKNNKLSEDTQKAFDDFNEKNK